MKQVIVSVLCLLFVGCAGETYVRYNDSPYYDAQLTYDLNQPYYGHYRPYYVNRYYSNYSHPYGYRSRHHYHKYP